MNEKISFPDLVTLLAAKLNVTKKEAEAFLKEFFTVSTEVISSGEELKINDLGVFKPIWVESRASVNVQTGEPVEIPGHYKLSFVPDKVLREAVNAPFSSFSVEILNDHVSTEQMMAVDNDEPLDDSDTDRDEMEPEQLEEPVAPEESATQEAEQKEAEPDAGHVEEPVANESLTNEADEPIAEPLPEVDIPTAELEASCEPVSGTDAESKLEPEVTAEADNHLPEPEPELVAEEAPVAEEPSLPEQLPGTAEEKKSETEEVSAQEQPQPSIDDEVDYYHDYLQKSSSRKAFWWGALAGFGVVVVLGVAAWFFLRGDGGIKIGEYTLSLIDSEVFASQEPENKTADTVVVSEPMDTAAVVEPVEEDTLLDEPVAQPAESVKPVQPEKKVTPAPVQPAAKPVVETIRSGVFLTTLARKYFGHKTFWVYIYEENKGIITNPNQVPIGTRLIIPDASKYHIDAKDPHSVETAKALAVKILSKYE